jgi:hypothetical protein
MDRDSTLSVSVMDASGCLLLSVVEARALIRLLGVKREIPCAALGKFISEDHDVLVSYAGVLIVAVDDVNLLPTRL